MLFRKKIERSCAYCTHSVCTGENQYLCSKKGFRSEEDSCWKFKYDPCKRVPKKAKAVDFSQFKDEDFSLSDD